MKESSKSRVVHGSHMRDSTVYSVLLGVTMGRNHGRLDKHGSVARNFAGNFRSPFCSVSTGSGKVCNAVISVFRFLNLILEVCTCSRLSPSQLHFGFVMQFTADSMHHLWTYTD